MKKYIVLLLIAFLAVIFAIPIFFTFIYSFKNFEKGFKELLSNCFPFYTAFWNSVIYTSIILIFQILIIIPTAFAFMELKTKLVNFIFVFYMILMMMPLQVTILPTYIGLRDLNLLDTRYSIIIPMIFSPMYVVLMRQYLNNINTSIIDALRLETNSIIHIITSGVIPQVKPCILATTILSISESWNILEQPMLFIKDEKLMPLTVFIHNIQNYGHEITIASSVISIIPMIIAYNFFKDYLVKQIITGETYE